jgi:transposase
MRYPDGGGLTTEGRARREKVRLQAAQMFEQGMDAEQVAQCLRVSTKSAYLWRRRWRAGGGAALASKGPGGNACKLDQVQLARLRAALDLGPAAYGWKQDQRWTLSRSAGPNSRGITRRISNVSPVSVRGAVAGTAVPFLGPSGAQVSGKAEVTCS